MLRTRSRLRGAAASEFLLVAAPLLLAGLGVVETTRWYLIRQAVSHALLEAARVGATHHASPAAIEDGLRTGLLPLYGTAATEAGIAAGRQRLTQRYTEFLDRYGLEPWRIDILSPGPAHFADFSVNDAGDGSPGIPNSYQYERHHALVARSGNGGRGPVSGETLFDANVLTIRLTYLHTPLVPGMRWLLRGLGAMAETSNYAGAAMARAGMLPIQRQLSIPMQSHPRVFSVGNGNAGTAPASAGPIATVPSYNDATCIGLWCSTAPPGPPASPLPSSIAPWPVNDTPSSTELPSVVPSDNDGCGVVLCCASA